MICEMHHIRRGHSGGEVIQSTADSEGPSFDTFSEINFWLTDPNVFLITPSRFEISKRAIGAKTILRERAQKNGFLVKCFEKGLKNYVFC